ncbi:MAG TPA: glutaminyl-peptide cyclotransferase, partial [Flavobacterium sp.]|nr:glutaminyl-peptide cyclotransferase [Flavobacterium sp.]
MKKYNLLTVILLSIAIAACDGSKKSAEKFFAFDNKQLKANYMSGDTVKLAISNFDNKPIDSIIYYIDNVKVSSAKGHNPATAMVSDHKIGYHNLKAIVYYDGQTTGQEVAERIEIVSSIKPKVLSYTIVNTFPHDSTSFIEGLEFYRDTLFESSGQNGNSYIRKVDYRTGKPYKQVDLEQEYFGEGITIINDQVFQLTWQSGVGFIYDVNTFKRTKTFNYDRKIEGWGMTNDGTNIYHSDGTEKIWKMNPANQKMIDYVNVYLTSNKIKSVNELEWINGKIYGNIW